MGEHEHSTKDCLLRSARKLFSRRGFDAASVKDIVDDAGVNVSLVSYHFGGKEGLYKSCISELALERLKVAQDMLKPPKSLEEFRIRLQMYSLEMLKFYVAEPEITSIVHRELDMNRPFMKEIFDEAIIKKFILFVEFLESAKTAQLLKSDLDTLTFAGMYFAFMMQLARADHLSESYFSRTIKDEAFQEQVVQQMEDIFFHGILHKGDKA